MPELALYNADIAQGMDSCHVTPCLVNFNGKITCIPPCSHVGHCSTDYKRWPFDRQSCVLKFGTWMHTGEEINYNAQKTSVFTSDARLHKDWKLNSARVEPQRGNFSCCPNQTFPSLKYTFSIERHSSSQVAMILTPAMSKIFFILRKKKKKFKFYCFYSYVDLEFNITLVGTYLF